MFIPNESFKQVLWVLFLIAWISSTCLFLLSLYFLVYHSSLATRTYKAIQINLLIGAQIADTFTLFGEPLMLGELPGLILLNIPFPSQIAFSTCVFGTFHIFGVLYFITAFIYGGFYRMDRLHPRKITKYLRTISMICMFIGLMMSYLVIWDLYLNHKLEDDPAKLCLLNVLLCGEKGVLLMLSSPTTLFLMKTSIPFFIFFFLIGGYLSHSAFLDYISKSKQMSRQTKDIQRYFTVVFLYQVAAIILFMAIPYAIAIFCVLGLLQGTFFSIVGSMCTLFTSIHSIMTSLTVVFATRPYRRTVKKWIIFVYFFLVRKPRENRIGARSSFSKNSITVVPSRNIGKNQ